MSLTTRRRFLRRATLTGALQAAWLARPACATLSEAPLTLIVPYPAGGLSDVIARTLQPSLARAGGRPVVIDNVGGASGGIGAQKALQQPADGRTLFQGSPNELVLAPLSNPALRYTLDDFRLVQRIAINPIVIFTRPGLPVRNADALAVLARQRAQDGQSLSYASVGHGSLYHLLGAEFSQRVGATMMHVPYRGGAPAYQDLMAGHVDLFFTVFSHKEVQLVREGRLQVIASLTPARQALFPEAPSVDEGQVLRGRHPNIWSGYFVRRDTSEPVVQRLHEVLGRALAEPTVRRALQAQAMVLPEPQNLDELARTGQSHLQSFLELARSIRHEPGR